MITYDFTWNRRSHIRKAARSYGKDRSLYLPMEPYTPPIQGTPGQVSYYDQDRLAAVRTKLEGVDRDRYLADILDHILTREMDTPGRVQALLGFVHHAFYYNPLEVPTEADNRTLVGDVCTLLKLHDARCGQAATTMKVLLEATGTQARTMPLNHHVVAEAFWEGAWHHCDALMFGTNLPLKEGRWLSAEELKADPYLADALPLECFVYNPEEWLTEDGYCVLGYVFGEWGSLPYYSYYLFGPEAYPPTLPIPLVAQRMDGQRVRLRWSESIKRNGGSVRYDVKIATDRALEEVIECTTLESTSLIWEVPQMNRMYFFGVRAIDDHRQYNPNTWYPWMWSNFVLVPSEQYGFYGVM